MTTAEILIKARKLLSDPRRWTKGAGRANRPDGEGYCYCALGAIYEAAGCYSATRSMSKYKAVEYDYRRAYNKLSAALPSNFRSVPDYNDKDDTTYEDIQKLFSDAINLALDDEAQESEAVAA